MSVQAVVRKDFRDGIRSKMLWGLIALFLLLVGGMAYLSTRNAPSGQEGQLALFGAVLTAWLGAVLFLIPLTGLVVSLKSITRERELGTIKILLSLPHSRRDVVLGKFVGRSGLLVTAIVAGFVPSGILLTVAIDNFPLIDYFLFLFVTILFGLAFVSVGIGVSAFTKTETRATVAGVLTFFLLYSWTGIVSYVHSRLGEPLGEQALAFVRRFNLFDVFVDAVAALLNLRYGDTTEAFQGVASGEPFYLQPWFAFVILALWIVVPLVIGYYRFENVDL